MSISFKYKERSLATTGGKWAMDAGQDGEVKKVDSREEDPLILEEMIVEEIFVDGICGVY